VKAIARRLRRLQDQFLPADGKQRCLRLVIYSSGAKNVTCRRTLCPDGTVMESVELPTSSDGPELTQEELDQWVASFPAETL
jgi:hypothetical protein